MSEHVPSQEPAAIDLTSADKSEVPSQSRTDEEVMLHAGDRVSGNPVSINGIGDSRDDPDLLMPIYFANGHIENENEESLMTFLRGCIRLVSTLRVEESAYAGDSASSCAVDDTEEEETIAFQYSTEERQRITSAFDGGMSSTLSRVLDGIADPGCLGYFLVGKVVWVLTVRRDIAKQAQCYLAKVIKVDVEDHSCYVKYICGDKIEKVVHSQNRVWLADPRLWYCYDQRVIEKRGMEVALSSFLKSKKRMINRMSYMKTNLCTMLEKATEMLYANSNDRLLKREVYQTEVLKFVNKRHQASAKRIQRLERENRRLRAAHERAVSASRTYVSKFFNQQDAIRILTRGNSSSSLREADALSGLSREDALFIFAHSMGCKTPGTCEHGKYCQLMAAAGPVLWLSKRAVSTRYRQLVLWVREHEENCPDKSKCHMCLSAAKTRRTYKASMSIYKSIVQAKYCRKRGCDACNATNKYHDCFKCNNNNCRYMYCRVYRRVSLHGESCPLGSQDNCKLCSYIRMVQKNRHLLCPSTRKQRGEALHSSSETGNRIVVVRRHGEGRGSKRQKISGSSKTARESAEKGNKQTQLAISTDTLDEYESNEAWVNLF